MPTGQVHGSNNQGAESYPLESVKESGQTSSVIADDERDSSSSPAAAAEKPPPAELSSTPSTLGRIRAYVVVFATILSLLFTAIDLNIVATAVPEITNHFHTVADVGWYGAAYRLGTGATQLAFGKLYKTAPLKWMLLISVSFNLLGSILCAAAVSSPMLVVGRAVIGIGTAGLGSGLFQLIVAVVPLRQRPIYTSIYGALETLAALIGPLLGGVITQNLSWRWCFWINVPPSGLNVAAALLLLPQSYGLSETGERAAWKQSLSEFDLLGNVLFIIGWTSLIIALNWGGSTYAWSSPQVIVLLVAFAVFIVLFAIVQYRKGDAALVPSKICKHRNVQMAVWYAVTASAALGLLEYYAPIFFQAVLGYSPARSGYLTIPCLIGFTVGMLVQGFGTSRTGQYVPFMILSSTLLPIGVGLLTTWGLETSVVRLVAYFAFAGFASGLGLVCTFSVVQVVLPKPDISQGIAMVLLANATAGAVFVSIGQAVFVSKLTSELRSLVPDPRSIEGLGLTEIKHKFHGMRLDRVETAFSRAIAPTWYLALALACLSLIAALFTEWKPIKKSEESK